MKCSKCGGEEFYEAYWEKGERLREFFLYVSNVGRNIRFRVLSRRLRRLKSE